MNPDDDISDQKLKNVQHDTKNDYEFIKSIYDRSLGLDSRKNVYSSFQLKAYAEDEFVKKDFKEMRCEMPGVPRSTFLMVFSPDGSKVASTHGNHHIYVTDVRTGKHIKTLIGHPRTPWCIAFHPSSNQIIASGCLGGQVRIWDLSGGSEVWTAENQTVIASIAFHPDERLLVIATYNELFFWDWSKPEPFEHVATASTKEKVRYVAFDKLGHKLITGITNSPQTRWERVRAPVPVPSPAGISYRRRITPRLLTNIPTMTGSLQCFTRPVPNREPLSSVPERERRITTCYRDLVQQYEVLVHRYLQIYRPPVMIDQGTDPMEVEPINLSQLPPSTSSPTPNNPPPPLPPPRSQSPIPSTSGTQRPRKSSATQPPKNKLKKSAKNDKANNESSNKLSYASSAISASLSSTSPKKRIETNLTEKGKTVIQNQIDRIQNESADTSNNASRSAESSASPPPLKMKKLYFRPSHSRQNVVLKPSVLDLSTTNSIRTENEETGEISPTNSTTNNSNNNNNNPETSEASTLRSFVNDILSYPSTSSAIEPTYKMRIKCSVIPQNPENANNNNGSEPTTKLTTQKNDISILIRSAEVMLAKFRENLEKRGLQNTELPSTSRSILIPPSEKPSKGTSTNDNENAGKGKTRKRTHTAHSKRPHVKYTPFSSTDSSEDEAMPKRPNRSKRPSNVNSEHTYAHINDAPSSSTAGHNLTSEHLNNEHSYAGLTSGQSSGDNTVRIEINLSSHNDAETVKTQEDAEPTNNPSSTQQSGSSTASASNRSSQSLNFNAELELLVTDLLANQETRRGREERQTSTTNDASKEDLVCYTCGGLIDERNRRNDTNNSNTVGTCPRNNICSRTATATAAASTSTSPTQLRPTHEMFPRRFYTHRLSAFHPTRMSNIRRTSLPSSLITPSQISSRLSNLNSTESPTRSPNFAPDEVINYAERVNEEELTRSYHPFDPPPELMSIHPENIGIGNMYSNIVQELESSLNDVRNIRANRRLGETSDMLSSFSERLDSIMTQSNNILRNLSNTLETLPANESETTNSTSNSGNSVIFPRPSTSDDSIFEIVEMAGARRPSRNNPLTSDHTYPLNPENPQASNMSPLMISLHLTVSHIQRQARLLRQQVESIERIDRAMLEVAQLQTMRQMFDEMHRYFSAMNGNDNASGVSSVRQMMAGTRISDTNPTEAGNDTNLPNATTSAPDSIPSTSNDTNTDDTQTSSRTRARKTFPRCLFLMHRQFRRGANICMARRHSLKDRISRRNIYRRYLPSRAATRPTIDISTPRGRSTLNILTPDTLPSMTRRLEHYLLENGKYIGRNIIPEPPTTNARSDVGEHIMMLRLNNARQRINRILSIPTEATRNDYVSVTVDGSSRFGARQTLTSILDTLTRFMEVNNNAAISSQFRSYIWEVIELSLLLSEILLLQIVDSIPPPSGMNLDPERESLSMRIDQMCTRMLQNRLSGGNQLTKSLRLLRLTVRHATAALGQTYTARRNAMLPNNDNERADSRQGLVDEIHNCLRNIQRHRESTVREEPTSGSKWYRTINDLITRCTSNAPNSSVNEGASTSGTTSQSTDRSQQVNEDDNSSDDNTSTTNNNSSIDRSANYRRSVRNFPINTSNSNDNESAASPGTTSEGPSDNAIASKWYRTINNLITRYTTNASNSSVNEGASTSGTNNQSTDRSQQIPIHGDDDTASDENTGPPSSNPTTDRRYLYRRGIRHLPTNSNPPDSIGVASTASGPSGSTRSRIQNVPTVQINDVPLPIPEAHQSSWHPRFLANRQRLAERLDELRNTSEGLFRPRFLHPFYASVIDDHLDDPHREQIYDGDIIATITPNHRIQVWEFSQGIIPNISNAMKNIVVNECKIHNDASVDYASDGTILVTLLPSGGYSNMTNRLGVYSLEWETLGQCLYVTSFEQNAVSVSLSPLNRHLVVGLASRRVSIMPSDKWTMARIFLLDDKEAPCGKLLPIRELEQSRDTSYMSVNCIRWLPTSGQGLVFATNTGHLRILT